MDHDFYDDETLYADRPGYLGQIYESEVSLDESLGNLAKFDWKEYLAQSEDFPDRELTVTFKSETRSIIASTWDIEAFFADIPSMILVNDGDGFHILYKAHGFTDKQILADADALYEAFISDLTTLKT